MNAKKKIKDVVRSILCILISISYVTNCIAVPVSAEVEITDVQLFDLNDNVCIYANTTNIQANSKQISSKIRTYNKECNNILDGILYNLDENTISNDSIMISNDVYESELSMYSKASASIYVTSCNINDTIISEDSINIGAKLVEGSNMVLCSKNSNININASDVELGGIIYAPNGKVAINADSVIFNGIIIAESVDIFAGKLAITNTNDEIIDKFQNYDLSEITSFVMYYSESDNRIGVSYEEDYSSLDLFYRYDDGEFQCIKDYNVENHLDLPKEYGYLEGYLIVKDKLGNEQVSNIVTFYNDGDCYERLKDSDGDGVSDAYEIRDLGTNPYVKDSDNDGILDIHDIYQDDEGEYYEVEINLDKETYEYISENICDMYICDEEVSLTNKNVCYLKKSKIDEVVSFYNDEDVLETVVYNKITGKEILRFYEDNYVQYIYDSLERKVATIANDGNNNVINMYVYNEIGQVVSIIHNDFNYDLEYNGDDLSGINIAGKSYIDYQYDEFGNTTKMVYGNGYERYIEYDELGNVIKVSDNDGVLYEWEYGEHYLLSNFTDYTNHTKIYYTYDEEEQISKIENNKGQFIEYIYGEYNNQKVIDMQKEKYIIDYYQSETSSLCEYSNKLVKARYFGNKIEDKEVFSYEGNNILEVVEKVEDNCFVKQVGMDEYKYLYDENGNLVEEYVNGELISIYEYDSLGQMIRFDSKERNCTIVYEYDGGGNVTNQRYYDLSLDLEIDNLGEETNSTQYFYDSAWKDLLIKYNDETIEYDHIGNPTSYINGMSFEWKKGRELYKINNINGTEVIYSYNSDGIRTSKNINGDIVEYYLEGNNVLYEKGQDYDIYYLYDEESEIIGFEYKDEIYIYKKNGLNDIVGIVDMEGNEVATYQYDEWGNILNISGNQGIARINPFRYKSYYYDDESGLYYLNSRYYDAKTGRFINADKYIDTSVGFHSNNMFAYCENSPVMRSNSSGESWVDGLVSAFTSYEPKYSTKYSWNPDTMAKYNCYGYATNVFNNVEKNKKNPGAYSNRAYSLSLSTIVNNVKYDMYARGYKEVKEITKSQINTVNGTVIALRIGTNDFHFMRYRKMENCWVHKPGTTALLKLKGNPYDYDNTFWSSEYYNGTWHAGEHTYTSDIKYIMYK